MRNDVSYTGNTVDVTSTSTTRVQEINSNSSIHGVSSSHMFFYPAQVHMEDDEETTEGELRTEGKMWRTVLYVMCITVRKL